MVDRQADDERRPLCNCADCGDLSIMALYDFSAHCQPDSRAGVLATAVETLEHREDPVQILLLEPDTVVLDRNLPKGIRYFYTADTDIGGFIIFVKLQPVGNKVHEQPLHLARMSFNFR